MHGFRATDGQTRLREIAGEEIGSLEFCAKYANKDLIFRDLASLFSAMKHTIESSGCSEKNPKDFWLCLRLCNYGRADFVFSEYISEEDMKNHKTICGSWLELYSEFNLYPASFDEETSQYIYENIEKPHNLFFIFKNITSFDFDNIFEDREECSDYGDIEDGYLNIKQTDFVDENGLKFRKNELSIEGEEGIILYSVIEVEDKKYTKYARTIAESFLSEDERTSYGNWIDSASLFLMMKKLSIEKIEENSDEFISIKQSGSSLSRFTDKNMSFINIQNVRRELINDDSNKEKRFNFKRVNAFRPNSLIFDKKTCKIFSSLYESIFDYQKKVAIFVTYFSEVLEIYDEIFANHSFISFPNKNKRTFSIFCITKFSESKKHFNNFSEAKYKNYDQISKIISSTAVIDIVENESNSTEIYNELQSIFRSKKIIENFLPMLVKNNNSRIFKNPNKWSAFKLNSFIILKNEREVNDESKN